MTEARSARRAAGAVKHSQPLRPLFLFLNLGWGYTWTDVLELHTMVGAIPGGYSLQTRTLFPFFGIFCPYCGPESAMNWGKYIRIWARSHPEQIKFAKPW